MGAPPGLRDRLGEPGTTIAERVPRRREPDLENQVAAAIAPLRPGADGTQGTPGDCLHCQTRHHPGVVSEAGRPEV